MAKIDDATEFRVGTLDDLLEAKNQGTPLGPAPAGDRYRQWAFASTGLSAILAVLLLVTLVTRDGGEASADIADRVRYKVQVPEADLSNDVKEGAEVNILLGQTVLARDAIVTSREDAEGISLQPKTNVEVAVTPEERARLDALSKEEKENLAIRAGPLPEPTAPPTTQPATKSTAPPAAEAPAQPQGQQIPPIDDGATTPSG